jgi:peptide deformylase
MLTEREADGFHAIVFQHEYDHLDGILYPDLISERTMFGHTEELAAAGII